MQSAQLYFSLPCGHGVQAAQLRFTLPCGQGLQSAQSCFSLRCGQGLQSAQKRRTFPWGHGSHSSQSPFPLPCRHRFRLFPMLASPRPPVLQKGAHSAPTNTTLEHTAPRALRCVVAFEAKREAFLGRANVTPKYDVVRHCRFLKTSRTPFSQPDARRGTARCLPRSARPPSRRQRQRRRRRRRERGGWRADPPARSVREEEERVRYMSGFPLHRRAGEAPAVARSPSTASGPAARAPTTHPARRGARHRARA